MRYFGRSAAVLAAGVLVAGCSFVKLTPQAEKVVVLSEQEVLRCEHIGQTTVSLMDKLAGVERDRAKVQNELNTLARNSAAEVNGDAVVAEGAIEDGKQRFGIYRCRR